MSCVYFAHITASPLAYTQIGSADGEIGFKVKIFSQKKISLQQEQTNLRAGLFPCALSFLVVGEGEERNRVGSHVGCDTEIINQHSSYVQIIRMFYVSLVACSCVIVEHISDQRSQFFIDLIATVPRGHFPLVLFLSACTEVISWSSFQVSVVPAASIIHLMKVFHGVSEVL